MCVRERERMRKEKENKQKNSPVNPTEKHYLFTTIRTKYLGEMSVSCQQHRIHYNLSSDIKYVYRLWASPWQIISERKLFSHNTPCSLIHSDPPPPRHVAATPHRGSPQCDEVPALPGTCCSLMTVTKMYTDLYSSHHHPLI